MVDCEVFTYLKNKKWLISIIKSSRLSIFKWKNTPCYSWWSCLDPFVVDVPVTEKPGGWFAQGETEECPRVNL